MKHEVWFHRMMQFVNSTWGTKFWGSLFSLRAVCGPDMLVSKATIRSFLKLCYHQGVTHQWAQNAFWVHLQGPSGFCCRSKIHRLTVLNLFQSIHFIKAFFSALPTWKFHKPHKHKLEWFRPQIICGSCDIMNLHKSSFSWFVPIPMTFHQGLAFWFSGKFPGESLPWRTLSSQEQKEPYPSSFAQHCRANTARIVSRPFGLPSSCLLSFPSRRDPYLIDIEHIKNISSAWYSQIKGSQVLDSVILTKNRIDSYIHCLQLV